MPQELLFDVYFLDYGDSQFIGKKDILELRADFLSLRFQAIECFLAHIQPSNGGSNMDEWDEKAVEKFESLVQVAHWKKLISKVVAYKERKSFAFQRQSKQRESSPIPGVELYDPDESTDKNIALELVKIGCAEMANKNFGDLTKSTILNTVEDVEEKKLEELKEPEEKKLPVTIMTEPSELKSTENGGKTTNLVSNGSGEKERQPDPESLFKAPGSSKKKSKDQLTDFLRNEQQATSKKQKKADDWNAMMDE